MPQRLTSTKYSAPSPRSGSLPRERLLAELDSGQAARLTLVSAPAGFGKSTLLTHWIERVAPSRSVAWLSLDDRDNDPALFWAYLGASLDRALGAAPDGGEPAREGSALAVAERLAGTPAPVAIVLDDYHLIDSATIQDQVAELIRDAPKGVQIVISTRVDPRLPLARLRAQGELVEVRASDLRFAPDEVEYYLTNSMDLPLQPAQVATLEARTEGWIAALQLAALSLRGRDDAAQFIAAFAGDDRFVVDYLAEEVLDRLEPELRAFLMDTCVLSRLSAPLCNAVAACGDAAQTLDRLERGNLFVVPLDDRREWYRYHHLFGDMLRARLRSTEPGRASELHARASAWWEGEGDLPEAISHALAAGDVERAADLVQEWAPRASRDRQEVTLRKWIEALPPEAVSERPQLALTHIGVLMQSGEFDGVEALLDAAEPAVSATADSPDPALRHLRAMSAAYRAAFAQRGGDLTTAAEHARRAFELTDPGDHLARGAAAGLSGLISWTIGDLAIANDSWQESIASLERAGHVADVMGGSIALTDILSAQGRPGEALEVLAARLRTSALQPAVLRGTADMHVAIAWIRCRQGDLAAARESLDRAESLGESAGLGQNPYRSRAALAHVLWAEGEFDDAAELLTEADRVYDGDFFPNVRPVLAMRARLDLARGQTRDALAWAANSGLTLDDEPHYLNEYAHLTLALTRLADASRTSERDAPSEVVVFVERLRDAAEARGGLGTLPDILVVLAKAHIARNAPAAAEATLREAVAVAEAQHTVGPFALAGPSNASLLKRLDDTPFVRDLRAALAAPGSARPDQSGSVATLSARELDVLRLLRSDLDGPQIARELFVSVNTLRTHTKSIFAKLGVSNRRAAVRVAEQRGLFAER